MRDNKVGGVDPAGAELDDIEIERPRSPAFGANPSSLALDSLKSPQQFVGIEIRFDEDHLIEIGWLPHPRQRSGLFNRGRRDQSGFG